MSTILGICSIDTGQASTQAAQVVHSHIASADSAGVAPMNDCREVAGRVARQALQIENDVARREQLAHAVGRAGRRAAAALGAGVEVEQVLPGEAGQRVDAQRLRPARSRRAATWRRSAPSGQCRCWPSRPPRAASWCTGAQARKPNTSSKCVHQVNRWAVVIVSTDITGREASATRLPNGDQAAPGIVGGRDSPAFDQKARDQDDQDHTRIAPTLRWCRPDSFGRAIQRRTPAIKHAHDRQRAEDSRRSATGRSNRTRRA